MLGKEIGDIIIIECEGMSACKVTHQYIDELVGSLSIKNTSTEHLKASIGMKANDELNDTISIMGHDDIHKAGGQAKCQGNNDYGK